MVHSSTTASMSGWRSHRRRAAATVSASACAASSVGRLSSSVRCSTQPSARPCTGVAGSAPAALSSAGPRLRASTVSTPGRRSAGSASRAEVHTGTGTAACSAAWKRTKKPQLVVRAAAPSATSACAAAMKGASSDTSASRTTRCGEAPATVRQRTGMRQLAAWPTSPGGRGNAVSSIRTPRCRFTMRGLTTSSRRGRPGRTCRSSCAAGAPSRRCRR